MASVELSGVSKRYGAVQALHGLSLSVAAGEVLVLLGPSGAGKTTTLRLVAGLEAPDAGQVRLNGRDAAPLHPAQRDLAFVFQQFSLYPHLSVYDNLAFPLRAPGRGLGAAEQERRVREVASLLRIDAKLNNRATRLSGGEMQRVAIGRALVREPGLLLMDEPMSSLDAKLREDLRGELRRIQQRLGATILYVTHDQVEATTLGDRVGILQAGRLAQLGTPREVYDDPASLEVARRLGSPPINVLTPAWCAPAELPGLTHSVAIRPEDVALGEPGPDPLPRGTVVVVERLGAQEQVVVRAPHGEVRALVPAGAAPGRGREVAVRLPRDKRLHFAAGGERIRT